MGPIRSDQASSVTIRPYQVRASTFHPFLVAFGGPASAGAREPLFDGNTSQYSTNVISTSTTCLMGCKTLSHEQLNTNHKEGIGMICMT